MSILRRHTVSRLLRPARYLCWWHNPMHRRADGVESLIASFLLILFLAAMPLAASVASSLYVHGLADASQTRVGGHWVTAKLLQDARVPATVGQADDPAAGPREQARWTGADGKVHVGKVQAMPGDRAGDAVRVWLDAAGRPSMPPASSGAIFAIAVSAGVGLMVAVTCVLEIVRRSSRWLLDRRRIQGWETEWQSIGPQWDRHAG
jgi:hypothetical protein